MADNKVNSGLLEFSEDQKVFVALDAETSEVKKAVTIDGDGVETDIQGVTPASDFTTAKVIFTIDNTITEPFYIDIVNLHGDKMYNGVDSEDTDPEGIDAVLYKGAGNAKVDSSYSVKVKAVTGNATIKTPLTVEITGDCSITYELDTVIN